MIGEIKCHGSCTALEPQRRNLRFASEPLEIGKHGRNELLSARILRMAEGDSLALRTRGHRSYAAARRASGKSVLSYKRRISLLSNRSSSTSR